MRGTWWMPLMLTAGLVGCSQVDAARSQATQVADRVEVRVEHLTARPADVPTLNERDVRRSEGMLPEKLVREHNLSTADESRGG